MGYLFLSLALFASLIKNFSAKKISGYSKKLIVLSTLTFVRMFFCVVLGFVLVLFANKSFSAFTIDKKTLLICFFCGLATCVFLVSWLFAVQRGAYMLLEVFLTLGVLVPLIFSWIFFNEKIIWLKWIGVVLLALSAYIMSAYSNKIRGGKTSKIGYLFLFIASLGSGFMQFTQKWFTQVCAERAKLNLPVCDASTFNFYTYIFSFALLCAFVLCVRFAEKNREKARKSMQNLQFKANQEMQVAASITQGDGVYAVLHRSWLIILIMSVCLFLNSYFATLAANYLSASELYPLQQGLSLVLSVVMSAIFFKEPITKTCIFGIFIAFFALLTINVFPAFL